MHLFLYIPPHSSHPPGMLKSLVFGLLRTYKIQNSKHEDFVFRAQQLFQRLIAQGYNHQQLYPLFNDALLLFEAKPPRATTPSFSYNPPATNLKGQLFFHIPFHPKDISRKSIRSFYDRFCNSEETNFQTLENFVSGNPMNVSKFTVAYSRPRNLRDHLIPSTLFEHGDLNTESLLKTFSPDP